MYCEDVEADDDGMVMVVTSCALLFGTDALEKGCCC